VVEEADVPCICSKRDIVTEKRPTSIKRALYKSKETYMNQNRPVKIKETYVNQNSPM